jgi:hypothetical protein
VVDEGRVWGMSEDQGVKIEKGVPLPPNYNQPGKGRPAKYPFRKMEVGDSFFLAGDKRVCGSVSSSCHHLTMRHPEFRFTVRKVEGGYRVWRIAAPVPAWPAPGMTP